MTNDTCIFCKIIKGDIPSYKVYEDEHTYAFLDIHPVNPGHTLVIPKTHTKDIYETPDTILEHTIKSVKKLSIAIKQATSADGINIHVNTEKAAGQEIFHLHFHIIPRFEGDGFTHWQGNVEQTDTERTNLALKIRSYVK